MTGEAASRYRRPAVVFNPTKADDPADRRAEICAALRRAGLPDPLWLETTPDDPGVGQSRRAVADGADLLLPCGGDGTVMACVTALAGSDVPMALLPAGTGNLLALNFGIPTDLDAAVGVAVAGEQRRIDVGAVGDRRFAVMAGMGFDAAMLRDAPEPLKGRIGWLAYLLSGARNLRRAPLARFTLHLDGNPPRRLRGRGVLVGNVGRLQGGIAVLAAAVCDDGVLEVAVLRPRTLADWGRLGLQLVRGGVSGAQQLTTFSAARVEVVADRPLAVELDGDVQPETDRLLVEIMPSALTLCVPPGVPDSG